MRICATSVRCWICRVVPQQAGDPYADLFADAFESYWRAAAIAKERGEVNTRPGSSTQKTPCSAVSRQTLRYESSMIFLASIVSGAPFIGLLGTVWASWNPLAPSPRSRTPAFRNSLLAFGRDACHHPGLVVAIPSVFGYNLLLGHTREMVTDLENYASSLADRIELESN